MKFYPSTVLNVLDNKDLYLKSILVKETRIPEAINICENTEYDHLSYIYMWEDLILKIHVPSFFVCRANLNQRNF